MSFSTQVNARLGQAALTTSYASVYTTPTGVRTTVKTIDMCNTTSSGVLVSVSIVPVSGTAGTSNALFYAASIPANDTLQWTGEQVLNAGDFISAKGNVSGITLTMSGTEAYRE